MDPMPQSAEAPVSAAVLLWSRNSAGVPDVHAAKKAGVPVERLREWESGASQPSIAQLRALADLYKRPVAVLLLDEVPKDFSVMRHFRRLPDSSETTLSPSLAAQTRAALVRREVALSLRAAAGEQTALFALRADTAEGAALAAERVRVALGISMEDQVSWQDERVAYKAWRAAVERVGTLVFQVGRVPVAEMRGLSAFQEPLPVILINGGDSVRGRTFSLFHEFGHLLLHEVHLCDWRDEAGWSGSSTEVWCNAFAANLLVPAEALSAEFRPAGRGAASEADWTEARRLADRFKVSQEVILRRLVTLGALSNAGYVKARKYLQELERAPKRAKKKQRGGQAPDLKAVWTFGNPFIRNVLGALHQRRITLSDASDYLDVKVRWIPRIRERVFFGGGSAAEEEHADL